MTKTGTCCLCGQRYTLYGNNPWPLSTVEADRCCRACDNARVIPARLRLFYAGPPGDEKKVFASGTGTYDSTSKFGRN